MYINILIPSVALIIFSSIFYSFIYLLFLNNLIKYFIFLSVFFKLTNVMTNLYINILNKYFYWTTIGKTQVRNIKYWEYIKKYMILYIYYNIN